MSNEDIVFYLCNIRMALEMHHVCQFEIEALNAAINLINEKRG